MESFNSSRIKRGEGLHRWRLWVLLCLLPVTVWSDIIISQVYEGNSNDRYVEVANTGTASVDLGAYQLAIWKKRKTSGDGTTDGITPAYGTLSGSLASGACRVFKNSSANNPSYANTSATSNSALDFDGNDAIALVNTGGVVIDLFGVGINNRDQNYSRRPSAKTASIYFNPSDWTASVFTVADEANKIFKAQGLSASLVLTTSVNAVVAKKGSLAYDTSKAAANHLVRELAIELSPLVRVNAVAPATVVQGSAMFPRDRVMASLAKYKIPFSEKEGDEELRTRLAEFYAKR